MSDSKMKELAKEKEAAEKLAKSLREKNTEQEAELKEMKATLKTLEEEKAKLEQSKLNEEAEKEKSEQARQAAESQLKEMSNKIEQLTTAVTASEEKAKIPDDLCVLVPDVLDEKPLLLSSLTTSQSSFEKCTSPASSKKPLWWLR